MFANRYKRNSTTITPEQNKLLKQKRVLVAGCGGLGGYVIEMLARAGIGHITAVDPDDFDETNLNRQLLSSEASLGTSKAAAAADRVSRINSEVSVMFHQLRIDEDNAEVLAAGHDMIIDALDNIPSRFVLQEAAKQLGIPLIHGAISGWYGQVAVLYPGDDLFDTIFRDRSGRAYDTGLGNPSFSPAVIAAYQVSECIKVFTGNGKALRNRMFCIDMLECRSQLVEL